MKNAYLRWIAALFFSFAATVVYATADTLDAVVLERSDTSNVVHLKFSGNPPSDFHVLSKQGRQIVIDLPGVRPHVKKTTVMKDAFVSMVQTAFSGGKTRVVVFLDKKRPFTVEAKGKEILVRIKGDGSANLTKVADIEFHRLRGRTAQVIVQLDGVAHPSRVERIENGRLRMVIENARPDPKLVGEMDVSDFDTVLKRVVISFDGRDTHLEMIPASVRYTYEVRESSGRIILLVKPKPRIKHARYGHVGNKPISMTFQDVPIRSVLQVFADFTKMNIVASDSVEGNITLRLDNVPWRQAFDTILKSKHLAWRQFGNVIWVAPLDEIMEEERKEMEHAAMQEKKMPLRTEIIQLNYARASEVAQVLQGMQGGRKRAAGANKGGSQYATNFKEESLVGVSSSGAFGGKILSERGQVNVDERTNILIVRDTEMNIRAVRKLVEILDRPVRQVLVSSKVVLVTDQFDRELGVRLNAARTSGAPNKTQSLLGGVLGSNNALVDLPAATPFGGLGIAVLKLNQFLMQLELTAMQKEGLVNVSSMPEMITRDNTEAMIEQGIEIPFATTSQNGTNTQFKKAVLRLKVKPHITPDDYIIMNLEIRKDSKGEATQSGLAINTRSVETTVRVKNGETLVLGGIEENESNRGVDKVPFFGDLPGIGRAFRRDKKTNNRQRLRLFVTPTIVEDALTREETSHIY